jgi:hypothetical protein
MEDLDEDEREERLSYFSAVTGANLEIAATVLEVFSFTWPLRTPENVCDEWYDRVVQAATPEFDSNGAEQELLS